MSSSEDDVPIGARALRAPRAVTVTYAASKYSSSVPRGPAATPAPRKTTAAPTEKKAVAPVRKTEAASKKSVRFDVIPLSEEAAPVVAEEAEAPVIAETPVEAAPVVAEEAPAEAAPIVAKAPTEAPVVEKAATDTAVADFQRRLRGIAAAVRAEPPPPDVPAFDEAAFKKDIAWKSSLQGTAKPESAPAGNEYVPIRSAEFQDFMVQVFGRTTPYMEEALRASKAGVALKKEIDKDACKRRDPNKVETFYYQKLVRDYLTKATPYRGLLVYHGLGSGKTCTSIAAAEALYWGGQRTIFVLTPATLSNNYRRELAKCGYFPLRKENEWTFLSLGGGGAASKTMEFFMYSVMGLPEDLVRKQGGAWIPNPTKPSNWGTLSEEARASILTQMAAHLNYRFKFIHYNGVSPPALAALAEAGYKAGGGSPFDNAVVIIDEVHNLVRTINGTQIGSVPLAEFIERVEPREPTWSLPTRQQREGYRYPRGYTLYRLLTNAVGCKIIALSATPMINYAQEFGIMMNLVGGEQRVVEISLATAARDPRTLAAIESWCLDERPDIDYWAVEEGPAPGGGRRTVLTVSPVPYGYAKVLKKGAPKTTVRGFVRLPEGRLPPVTQSPERSMTTWAVSLIRDLEARGILAAGTTATAESEAAAAAPGPWGSAPSPAPSKAFRVIVSPLLYDSAKRFVDVFVDRNTLAMKHGNLLRARATGLISYYKGGSEELMPRTTRNELVRVPMSDYMFQEYSRARMAELELEDRKTKTPGAATEGAEGGETRRRGTTRAEMDLYAQATKTQQTGFLALSRAACNWVFPEDIPRPQVSVKQQTQLLGMEQDKLIAADLAVDTDADLAVAPAAAEAAAEPDAEAEAAEAAAVMPDAPDAVPAGPSALDTTLAGILGTLMSGLEAKSDEVLNKGLAQFSPKYAEILGRIRESAGPVLVYSQFKTLEGLGIFAAALRAADEKFLPLDIQKNDAGEWEIPAPLMDRSRPRYVLYTGDQDLEKRRLLLQLYNADVSNLPPTLSAQCAELLDGAPDNRDGRVCRVFMITQSGAEGISLFNTRQVHIMEPYWNNVRIQQVVGRAIRLCSHMNLPWDDRTVDVFTYLSVFTTEQKTSGAKGIMMADNSKTTDEMIFEIATAKQRLADGLFEIAQDAAIDCEIHTFEHGAVAHCFRYPAGQRPMFLYHPDLERDVAAVGAARR